MPHKRAVIDLLDEVTPQAGKIGSVNTVLNRDGRLIGDNTDIRGVMAALEPTGSEDRFVILGTGGMSRTFQAGITGSCRVLSRAELDTSTDATVVINATPTGMPGVPSRPNLLDQFPSCRIYIESVVNRTPTVVEALRRGLFVFTGDRITMEQACAQFELFTGRPAPREIMRRAWENLVNE